jgi:DNA-binding transcriptional MerR regulator
MSRVHIDIERTISALKDLNNSSLSYFDDFDEKKYKPSDLGISARVISNWKENDLLINSGEKGWHKFNLTECVWLKIIQTLREFNLPLDVIREIKSVLIDATDVVANEIEKSDIINKLKTAFEKEDLDQLKEAFDSGELQEFMRVQKISPLESIVMDLIITRHNYRLMFNLNGDIMIHKDNYEEELRNIPEYIQFLKTAHISVSVNSLFYAVTNELIEDNDLKKLSILTEQEFKVIESIRKEDIKKVEINFSKDQKPELIKITQVNKVESISKIKDFFIQGGYQDIKITTQDGGITYFENTIKIKV